MSVKDLNPFGGSAKKTMIGLDIGNYSVKVAQINKVPFKKEKYLSFAVTPIQGERTSADIVEAIKQAYNDVAVVSKEVNLSIAGSNLITRYIILPQMNQRDLAKALEFEIERYVPYKKDDVVSEYHVLGNLPNNKVIVLLAAAERVFIQQKVNLVKEAGLLPSSVNIDCLALAEAYKAVRPASKETVALLDIGYRLSKLLVLEDGVPYFSRELETGEFNVIHTISKSLGVDLAVAQELERNPQDKAEEITKIVKTELNNLIDEISLFFEYCERNLEKKVETLCLTGGGSRMDFLLESMERIPHLKVSLLDPTMSFRVSSSITAERLKEHAHLLAVAIGLAIS